MKKYVVTPVHETGNVSGGRRRPSSGSGSSAGSTRRKMKIKNVQKSEKKEEKTDNGVSTHPVASLN